MWIRFKYRMGKTLQVRTSGKIGLVTGLHYDGKEKKYLIRTAPGQESWHNITELRKAKGNL